MVKSDRRELQVPDQIRSRLLQFQKRIWKIKLIEALCAGLFGLLVSWLLVFVLDRFFETSSAVRMFLLLAGSIGLAVWFPWVCHRWIWKSRSMEQVARILKVKRPWLGDYFLSMIELVRADHSDGRSETLTRAALDQADHEAATADFSDAVPNPRHRQWIWIVSVPAALGALLLLFVPQAGVNAFQRWILPWSQIDRYTFTRIEPLPDTIVVPLSEKTNLDAQLKSDSRWEPDSAVAILNGQPLTAKKTTQNEGQGAYEFSLPPLSATTQVNLRIGDIRQAIEIDPKRRPEISDLSATIELPTYLQRNQPVQRDIRGGGLSVVSGSTVAVQATTTRELASASVDGRPVSVDGQKIVTQPVTLSESRVMELNWRDQFGLSSKSPLKLDIRSQADEPPSLVCRNLNQQRIIMEKDVLSFEVDGYDDFGLKALGMEWRGTPSELSGVSPASGEKIVFAGDPNTTEVTSVVATFSPQRESIRPQMIRLRLFAEDYLPDRQRVYSSEFTVFVLSEDDHAIWITGRLDKWFQQSLETYDQEQQLFEQNVELRSLSAAELDLPEARRKLEAQAAAENAQSNQLKALTQAGESLIQEATGNDRFSVDDLDRLAEMVQTLKDIQENRMPQVADLLAKASSAAGQMPSDAPPGNSPPGNSPAGDPSSPPPAESVVNAPPSPGSKPPSTSTATEGESPKTTPPPTISLTESNHNTPQDQKTEPSPAGPPPPPSRLLLPAVALDALPEEPDDSDQPDGGEEQPQPAAETVAEAVDSQEELLAEFQKVAEELRALTSNLEGSTFVKRLKAMSRRELEIVAEVDQASLMSFGEEKSNLRDATLTRTRLLAERQESYVKNVQNIEDDLAAFVNRNQGAKYKAVLDEMRKSEIVSNTALVAKRMIANEPGTSIADAELLADTFDRWAEQLVGPGPNGGTSPDSEGGSLPPSIILEVLKVLAAEIDLREETRELQQAKPQLAVQKFVQSAQALSVTQRELAQRTTDAITVIQALPQEGNFGDQIRQLSDTLTVMNDATKILESPDTGSPAIAAETEVIELLLEARRLCSKSNSTSGDSPGQGTRSAPGTGLAALPLAGISKELEAETADRTVVQTTGKSGRELPEEFRNGLDRYFNDLENDVNR